MMGPHLAGVGGLGPVEWGGATLLELQVEVGRGGGGTDRPAGDLGRASWQAAECKAMTQVSLEEVNPGQVD